MISKRGTRICFVDNKKFSLNKHSKKSQFYLMAAVIIIAVIIGFVTISNYVKPRETSSRIYDLGKEIGLETGEVVSYGVYQKEKTDALIENWTNEYYRYSQEKGVTGDWVFIYGDEKNVTFIGLTNASAGGISLIIGEKEPKIRVERIETQKYHFEPKGNNISIEFNKVRYSMDIKEGENFFFIIREGRYATQG